MKNENGSIGNYKKVLDEPPLAFRKWFDKEEKVLIATISKDAEVLSIGCGNGRELKYIIKKTKNLTGIDHDETAVKYARENLKDYPKVKILLAKAESLPFETNSFDYVICMGTFTNLGNKKQKVLKEAKRVLRKGGKIVLSCYSEDAWEERKKLYKNLKIPILKIEGTKVHFKFSSDDNVTEQFSKEELEKIFHKAELKLDKIRKVGIGYICVLSDKVKS